MSRVNLGKIAASCSVPAVARLALLAVLSLGIACSASPSLAQSSNDGQIHVLHVQGNVYMLVGGGANITVQAGDNGVLLVDTGTEAMADKVLAAVRSISDKPIRYIIDTTLDTDHTGGNEKIAKAGSTIAGGNVVGDIGASAGNQAAVLSAQGILDRMSAPTGKQSPRPQGAWPTESFTTPERKIFFNGEGIEIIHQPAARTDGDSMVFFRRSDVISAGDIFWTTGYPVIELDKGGTIQGVLDGLNRIIEIAIPVDVQEGGTMVIPGHGRLCDVADVVFYQEMVTIIRDRIQDMVNKGMTLEQVKAARPTQDYDVRYGATTGPWTTDMFIEAVYKTLHPKK